MLVMLCVCSVTVKPMDCREMKIGQRVPWRPELLLDCSKMESTILFIWKGFHVTNLVVCKYPETDHIEEVLIPY